MSGIIFYRTERLATIVDFYHCQTQAKIWLNQGKCVILQHGNILFGFCEAEKADRDGIITFFYPSVGEVNFIYKRLSTVAEHSPRINPAYNIYHFFARDPEGRKIEFQAFLHRLSEHWTGSELLCHRRSIRQFSQEEISDQLLHQVMEVCRYSPTSRNSQSYYYVITKDYHKKKVLANIRDSASRPLAEAPLVIAVCAAADKTLRVEQDACIAAYHLLLAAAQYGLGTCWITDMDRPEVKELLSIPSEDRIACLTPLGFPLNDLSRITEDILKEKTQLQELPSRRKAIDLFRFV